MKRLLLVSMLALLALAPLSANAGETGNPLGLDDAEIDQATKSMEEAAKNLTNILGLVLRSIPQYEMPIILPNGDILIRRVHKEDQVPAPDRGDTPDGSKI